MPMSATMTTAERADTEYEAELAALVDRWTAHMRWRKNYDRWREDRLWQEDHQAARFVGPALLVGGAITELVVLGGLGDQLGLGKVAAIPGKAALTLETTSRVEASPFLSTGSRAALMPLETTMFNCGV